MINDCKILHVTGSLREEQAIRDFTKGFSFLKVDLITFREDRLPLDLDLNDFDFILWSVAEIEEIGLPPLLIGAAYPSLRFIPIVSYQAVESRFKAESSNPNILFFDFIDAHKLEWFFRFKDGEASRYLNFKLKELCLEKLLKANPEGVLITELASGKVVSINQEFCNTFKWNIEKSIGLTTIELGLWADTADRNTLSKVVAEYKEGEVLHFETGLKASDGERIPVNVDFSIFVHSGKSYLIGVITNLTDKKKNELVLSQERIRFKTLIETAPDVFFYTSAVNKLDYVNPQFSEQLGYTSEEALLKPLTEFLSDYSKKEFLNLDWVNFLKKGETKVIQPFEVFTKSGALKKYVLYLIPVKEKKSEKVIFTQGIAKDITEELQAKKLLENSIHKNQIAFEELKAHQLAINEHNLWVRTDPNGIIKELNAQYLLACGYSGEELIGSKIYDLYAEDRPHDFFKEIQKTVSSGSVWKGNICQKHKNGAKFWLKTSVIPKFNEFGELTDFLSLKTDISDLKQVEEALSMSEANVNNILNSNPHRIWSVDLDKNLQAFNNEFSKMYFDRFQKTLKIGDPFFEYSCLDTSAEEWKRRYSLAFKGEVHTYENRLYSDENSSIIDYISTIYPTYNARNEITGANVFAEDVSEKRKMEADLKESNFRLEETQVLASVADWSYSYRTRTIEWSKNFIELTGVNLLQGTAGSIRPIIAQALEPQKLIYTIRKCIKEKKEIEVLLEFYTSEEQTNFLECKFFPVVIDGELIRLKGIIRNVTKLARLELNERAQKKLYLDIARKGTGLLQHKTIDGVYKALVALLAEWFDFEVLVGSSSMEFEGDQSVFSLNALHIPTSLKEEFSFLEKNIKQQTKFKTILGIQDKMKAAKSIELGPEEIGLLPFLEKDFVREFAKKHPKFKLVGAGLVYNESFKGSCFLLFPEGIPSYFPVELFDIITNQASLVMGLLEIKNKMQDKAVILSQALDAGALSVWSNNLETSQMKGDLRMVELIGKKPETGFVFDAEEIASRMRKEDKDNMALAFDEHQAGKRDNYQYKYPFKCFDGKTRWFEDYAKISRRNAEGSPLEVIGVRKDITQEVKREQQLLLMESTVTHAKDGVLITDVKEIGKGGPYILYANKAFEEISGYSSAELIGKNPRFLQGAETESESVRHISEAIKNGKPCQTELVNYHKDGNKYWINISIVPIFNGKKELTHFVALQKDTTRRRNQEMELRETLLRLNLATQTNSTGIWDLDLKDGSLIWDDAMYKLYGVEKETFGHDLTAWEAIVHPDDLKKTTDHITDVLLSNSEEYAASFRIIAHDEVRYLAGAAKVLRDDKNVPYRMVGLNWDFTSIENQRKELNSVRINSAAMINTARGHIWSIDKRFRLLSANQSYLDYLGGLAKKTIQIGDSALDLKIGLERATTWKPIYDEVLGGLRKDIEIKQEENGELRFFKVFLNPIFNELGQVTGVSCYSFDSTQISQQIKAIDEQNQKLRDIAWLQSHVLRAPVARILGLIELLNIENVTIDPDLKEVIDYILASTKELDEVIHQITEKTSRVKLD